MVLLLYGLINDAVTLCTDFGGEQRFQEQTWAPWRHVGAPIDVRGQINQEMCNFGTSALCVMHSKRMPSPKQTHHLIEQKGLLASLSCQMKNLWNL